MSPNLTLILAGSIALVVHDHICCMKSENASARRPWRVMNQSHQASRLGDSVHHNLKFIKYHPLISQFKCVPWSQVDWVSSRRFYGDHRGSMYEVPCSWLASEKRHSRVSKFQSNIEILQSHLQRCIHEASVADIAKTGESRLDYRTSLLVRSHLQGGLL